MPINPPPKRPTPKSRADALQAVLSTIETAKAVDAAHKAKGAVSDEAQDKVAEELLKLSNVLSDQMTALGLASIRELQNSGRGAIGGKYQMILDDITKVIATANQVPALAADVSLGLRIKSPSQPTSPKKNNKPTKTKDT